MRRAFGKTITEIALNDPSVIIVSGDFGFGSMDIIRKERPKQFLNVGIMEQSMVSMAAGMALQGLKPWVYTITPFLIERAFEQIKLDIDVNCANVKIVGYADYKEQGVTHEEILIFDQKTPFKNIRFFYPVDSAETAFFTRKSYLVNTPTFISMKRDRNV